MIPTRENESLGPRSKGLAATLSRSRDLAFDRLLGSLRGLRPAPRGRAAEVLLLVSPACRAVFGSA